MSAGKGRVDGLGIAHAHGEGGIGCGAVMDQWRSSADRVLSAHHKREDFVIDGDQLCRIARLRFRRSDNDRDPLADIARAVLGQRGALCAEALGSAHVLGHHLGIERAEPVRRPVLARQHSEDARRLLRRSLLDRANPRMGMRRKNKHRMRLAGQIDIRDVASASRQKTRILLARHGLSDAEAHDAASHCSSGRRRGAFGDGFELTDRLATEQ
jgi:hypothetical protein